MSGRAQHPEERNLVRTLRYLLREDTACGMLLARHRLLNGGPQAEVSVAHASTVTFVDRVAIADQLLKMLAQDAAALTAAGNEFYASRLQAISAARAALDFEQEKAAS